MSIEPVSIEQSSDPGAEIATAARAVHEAALGRDGVSAFSEQVRLRWAPGAELVPGEVHLLTRTRAGVPAGYAHLDPDGTGEIAVHPDARRAGHGRALLSALASAQRQQHDPRLQVWAHGDLPAARALAASAGFRAARELLQLRLALAEQPGLLEGSREEESVAWPAGVGVRTFRPGLDDVSWLALNARAFAQHPEQGRMTLDDLRARMAEPWFDPDGFLIAETEGAEGAERTMVGFHWTKVHPGNLGEIYVLGVDPSFHGRGLGRALALAGLRLLRARGLAAVMLYVEADNLPAVRLYRGLNFSPWTTDVMYRADPA